MKKFREILSSGDKGFTLIELLVVIAVLGILAGIAIPRLGGVTDKATLSEATSALGSFKTAMEMYYTQNTTSPGTTVTSGHPIFEYVDYDSINTDDWAIRISDDSENSYVIYMDNSAEGLSAKYDKSTGEVDTSQDSGDVGNNW